MYNKIVLYVQYEFQPHAGVTVSRILPPQTKMSHGAAKASLSTVKKAYHTLSSMHASLSKPMGTTEQSVPASGKRVINQPSKSRQNVVELTVTKT